MDEPLDLDAIEDRAEAATGPDWIVVRSAHTSGVMGKDHPSDPGHGASVAHLLSLQNAEFIAAARSDVPALVLAVRRLQAEVATLESERDDLLGDLHDIERRTGERRGGV